MDSVGENTECSFCELPAIDIDQLRPVRERYRGLGSGLDQM